MIKNQIPCCVPLYLTVIQFNLTCTLLVIVLNLLCVTRNKIVKKMLTCTRSHVSFSSIRGIVSGSSPPKTCQTRSKILPWAGNGKQLWGVVAQRISHLLTAPRDPGSNPVKDVNLFVYLCVDMIFKRIVIYANLVILATAVTFYQLSVGESGTLRWVAFQISWI